MQVIATAGHVDHGKSTLVRALTGMEPDRWAEERRRGMTIDLGYAWTRLPSGIDVAFVDVPGHQRFATNMLAGVGPVPAAMVVVAADAGWAAQTEEHVRALHALGVTHGLVAVTRSDLADPSPAVREVRERLGGTTLAGLAVVAVSGVTGAGLEELRAQLDILVGGLPVPAASARVRLWVDRCFTVSGAGTVATGTLPAGTVRRGDVLELRGRAVTVRGLQALGRPVDSVAGVARVAVNLRGVATDEVGRGTALLTPGAWRATSELDVRAGADALPSHLVVHVGSAAVPARARVLAADASGASVCARLRLNSALPLQVGDRLLLRDPGGRRIIAGAVVLDPAPAPARGRAGRDRLALLRDDDGNPNLEREVGRRHVVEARLLRAVGVEVPAALPSTVVRAGAWLIARPVWDGWLARVESAVGAGAAGLLDSGLTRGELATRLGLPAAEVAAALVEASPGLEEAGGRVRRRGRAVGLHPQLAAAVARLAERLADTPFRAPEQPQLAGLGLGRRELGAAAAAGAILRLPGDVVLLPDAPERAVTHLASLPQPFTMSAARQTLDTTRRVAVPLLEHLDALRLTERVDGDLRRVRR